jgi:sodium pump decarboxylase gamma subunit
VKKKISVLVCVIMAALCFTGCSAKKSEVEVDVTTMQETAEVIISSFAAMGEQDFAQYMDLSEYQLNYVMMNSGLRIEAESFLAMIKSWQAGEEECGAYVSHGEYKVDVKGDEIVVSTEAEYEDRKATLSFTFNEDSYLESMDVSATYAMNEILAKAGLNTLLGMGTVFAVLIFLAFLISLMQYIPNIMEWFEKITAKNKQPVVQEVQTSAPSNQAAPVVEQVDAVDDLELVAVITAAIAAQEGTTTDGFVVRSIRRRPTNNWK